ncbi:MAG: O-acetylhomoserine aminocarboxypropyltransferase/cysteine synthase [Gammaproteobacteria bacterium]|nr:O-acetylhomoserine aminocarboxypropyltransferase/cysteine synthase [Gammaproteobacteria bacterium]
MKLETLCLHAGTSPDPTTKSRAMPIHRTTAYVFDSTEHAANLFGLRELGNIYSRIMNPTQDALEQRVAALEGGAAGLAHSSGTAAIFNAINNICRAGDEIVSAGNLYGGTFTMFNDIFPQFGLKVHFVDANDPDAFAAAINDNTRALFCETLSNPACDVTDIEAVAAVAHGHGLPLIVDATFTTPVLQRSIDFGADIVVNSLTKWMGGHGTGIGGMVVDAGRFDWRGDKFPLMNEPDSSYHGLRWAHDLPEELAPIAYLLRMRTVPLRNLGACISPDNAWIFAQGLETLPLRMERHCTNAHQVARYLQEHEQVDWVRYPGLPGDPAFDKNDKYLNGMGGPMVVFEIQGGQAAGQAFIEGLELFSHLANVGDAKSLAIHPATTTHSQLNPEQQAGAGITPGLVRLAVGIEHIDDIVADIDRALAAANS